MDVPAVQSTYLRLRLLGLIGKLRIMQWPHFAEGRPRGFFRGRVSNTEAVSRTKAAKAIRPTIPQARMPRPRRCRLPAVREAPRVKAATAAVPDFDHSPHGPPS